MTAPLPPGPKMNWIDAIVRQFSGKPPLIRNLEDVRTWFEPFDGVVYYRAWIFDVYVVWLPEFVHRSIVEQPMRFGKGAFVQRSFGRLMGKGLFTSDGDFWKRQRKLAQPAFHTQRIEAYIRIMVDHALRMVADWHDKQQVILDDEMSEVTMQIAARTLFDADLSADTAHLRQAMKTLVEVVFTLANNLVLLPAWIPTSNNRRMSRVIAEVDTIIYGIIEERRAAAINGEAQDKGDLLSMFMLARDDEGKPMSDQQLRDELMTAFIAGHETTALALTWAFYALAQNPEAEAKLREELQQVLGDRPPMLEDLPKLVYTEHVIKETLRHYPPLPLFPRQVMQETEVNGYWFKKNSAVIFAPWLTHHDAALYPEPEKFQPERWTPEFEKALPKYAFFPFGGGPRICIGNSFAMLEARLILATVIQHYRLTLVPEQTIEPTSFLSMRPKYSMKMALEPVAEKLKT